MSEDERAIRTLIANWIAASRSGDVARVLSLMADDVLFLTPGQPPFGKEKFAEASRAMRELRIDGKSDVQEVVVSGEWAWCRTQLQVTIRFPDGKTMSRSGQTLSILRRQADGSWLLARDANLLAADPSS
ncbi:MAG TPA: SgcJ/EcaC family oxidoreductase [Polyangiaceae bacterium]|jgi:uncharacterized protein (TIGR02246 family)|nr:SgcJ/EcaC family oxidoreductase [Polyangiaceae bacterium]